MDSKSWKTNVKFEHSTFEIGYKQNFVKIRKLILLRSKCPKLGICAQNFGEKNARFEISTFEIGYVIDFVNFWSKRPNFGHLSQKFEKQKLVENYRYLQFQNFGSFRVVSQFFLGRFGCFWVVSVSFRSFWLVSGRFGSFRVSVSMINEWVKYLSKSLKIKT